MEHPLTNVAQRVCQEREKHVENSSDVPCCPALFAVWDREWEGGGRGQHFHLLYSEARQEKLAEKPPE